MKSIQSNITNIPSKSAQIPKIMTKPQTTYLGQKGYTLLKSELSQDQIAKIKSDLSIKPYTPGMSGISSDKTYPAYRESANKLYMPHYYGVSNFGSPKEIKIPAGDDVHMTFAGVLRENQVPVVKTYLDYVRQLGSGGGLIELACAAGKTVDGLYIAAALQKKTLIIVHKEFLMNQWIERISQFIPNARVGRIQGQIIDIENKDIVIGMLQSLSMKDYPSTMFDSFGLTIIDEVHHISSEVFSKVLFKLVTKYMLGLSATMNRKDGTTNVFKMFLGDIIYKGKREDIHNVTVRSITYKTEDVDFNRELTDFRGNPAYSSMISKLCEYSHRSEFILRVIADMRAENPTQQIMVLAHNKNILKYIYDAIVHRNIATVGYYVGGMKEKALKETETKEMVIATFAMASEALDIKTLTTLIMVTPKTDIEQSVGRILRERHSNPVIVDIIDSHSTFQKQWIKRKAFYKKHKYNIIGTDSTIYQPDVSKWKTIYAGGLKRDTEEEDTQQEDTQEEEDEEKDITNSGKCLIKLKPKPKPNPK